MQYSALLAFVLANFATYASAVPTTNEVPAAHKHNPVAVHHPSRTFGLKPVTTATIISTGSIEATYTRGSLVSPTVVVEKPAVTQTIETIGSIDRTLTVGNDAHPTVVIEKVPNTSTVTYTGTAATTFTTGSPASPTVVVEKAPPTVTVTSPNSVGKTFTTGPAASPTVVVQKCSDPSGWQWAHVAAEDLSAPAPEKLKGQQPDDEGVCTEIGFKKGYEATGNFYSSTKTMSTNGYAMNHHAYLRVPASGKYTFSLTSGSSVAWAWVGDFAYSGFTASNNVTGSYTRFGAQHNSEPFSAYYEVGSYVPVRVISSSGKYSGTSGFNFTVFYDDGIAVDSEHFVQYFCEDVTTQFAPFGKEA